MKFLEDLLPTIVIIGIYIDINYNWDLTPLYIPDVEFNLLEYIKNSKNLDLDRLKIQPINKTCLNIVSNRPN